VVVTWTKSTGAIGYKVYRNGVLIDTTGDVSYYEDTTGDAPNITPGTATAEDGTSTEYVSLSITGQSIANGNTGTYKVKAMNGTGDSIDSNTDNGYRIAGILSYQWQMSAADSDADYSNISGATTDTYNAVEAPVSGTGRYFRCVVSATGSSPEFSAVDRGYRAAYYPVVNLSVSSTEYKPIMTGDITVIGQYGTTITKRAIVWSQSSHADPGNVAPADSDYEYYWEQEGEYSTGEYYYKITDALLKTTYYCRAVVTNSDGLTSYSEEIDFHSDPGGLAEDLLRNSLGVAAALAICIGVFKISGENRPGKILPLIVIGIVFFLFLTYLVGVLF